MAPTDAPQPDPADQDPRERDLAQRNAGAGFSPWLVILCLILLGVGIYVASALI